METFYQCLIIIILICAVLLYLYFSRSKKTNNNNKELQLINDNTNDDTVENYEDFNDNPDDEILKNEKIREHRKFKPFKPPISNKKNTTNVNFTPANFNNIITGDQFIHINKNMNSTKADFVLNNLIQSQNKNVIYSRINMLQMLGILYIGSSDKNTETLKDIFRQPKNTMISYMNNVNNIIYSLPNIIYGNSFWVNSVNNSAEIDPYFVELMTKYGKTNLIDINELAFKPDMEDKLTEWINKKTNSSTTKITLMNDVTENPLILLSVFCFQEKFKLPFNSKNTKNIFFGTDDKKPNVNMMTQQNIFDFYEEPSQRIRHTNQSTGGIKLLKLEFVNDTSLIIVLNDTQNKGALSYDKLIRYIEKMKKTKVSVSIPKFEVETEFDAVWPLLDNNLDNTIFMPSYKMIAGTGIYPSKIIQKNKIIIQDEKIDNEHSDKNDDTDYKLFIADTPFTYYIIHDNSQLLLCSGYFNGK